MPNYDFECISCGCKFEQVRPLAHRFYARCPDPNCGSVALRLPSAPAFQLKGKGFHVNDYPKKPG